MSPVVDVRNRVGEGLDDDNRVYAMPKLEEDEMRVGRETQRPETGMEGQNSESDTTVIGQDTGGMEDVIPNGGYGWVNVFCFAAQNAVTWGTSYYQIVVTITS